MRGDLSGGASSRLAASTATPCASIGGWLTGGLKVVVVRSGAKASATHRLTRAAADGRRLQALRAQLAAVIRACTDHLGLSGGPARSARAQRHQMPCCCAA
jgi:hypothetical protein